MSTRDIKRRIKSVSNIEQITRAMQLVATSKMKKSQKRASDADLYARCALEILENMTKVEGTLRHSYWQENESKKIGLVLITSDRGFCGGLNVSLFNKVLSLVRDNSNVEFEVVAVGKKGRDFARKVGIKIVADFSGLKGYFTVRDITPIAKIATSDYLNGDYKKIYICYNQFINTLVQKPVVKQILPVSIENFKDIAEIYPVRGRLSENDRRVSEGDTVSNEMKYIFEPNIDTTLEELVPHLVEVDIYKALLEGQASEHSARMVAMKNATEKAGELIGDFQLAYNQARQASITKEIAEISSGAMTTV